MQCYMYFHLLSMNVESRLLSHLLLPLYMKTRVSLSISVQAGSQARAILLRTMMQRGCMRISSDCIKSLAKFLSPKA